MYFSESQFKPPLKNSWGCQMIRPFSAGLMSSPHFRPMFGHGFQRHFEATNLFEPTDPTWGGRDGGNLPFSDHWKCQRGRWGGGSKFLGFNTNALHEWGILQRKHTKDIVGLLMMRQISLSQMFWWLKGFKIVAVSHRDGLDGCTPTCTDARHAQERTFLNLIFISTSISTPTPTSTFISNVISSSQ